MNTNIVQVKNISDKDFEWRFNGKVYAVKAGETAPILEDAARHGKRKSTQRWNPNDNSYEQRLIIVTEESEPEEPIKAAGPDDEFLDRESMGEEGAVEKVSFANPDAFRKGGRRK